jgi:hypothetical protein
MSQTSGDLDTQCEPSPGIETTISLVGKRLTRALRAVLHAIPGGPYGPQELARALGVNKDLSSRALSASDKKDPLAAVHQMPGPAPLRLLLSAALRKGVPKKLIEEAGEAVRHFDRLIRLHAGDRVSLDGIISTWLPDARERFELFNKQAAYRGMAQLKGATADVTVHTAVLYPAADGERLDGVWIFGSVGLRRIRPTAVVHYCSYLLAPDPTEDCPLTLDGQAVVGLRGLLLEQFCSAPLPPLDARHHGATVYYTLGGDGVGPASAVDLFFAELTPGCVPRYQDAGRPRRYGASAEVTTPTKTLVFDVLLHEQAYPGLEPSLLIYDTAIKGVANVNDQTRDIDRLDVNETIRSLGWGAPMFRASEVCDYVEILRYVFGKLGRDDREFRGYRCKVQYPIYGAQLCMAFTPPEKP